MPHKFCGCLSRAAGAMFAPVLIPLIVACALFMENLEFDGSRHLAAGDRGVVRREPGQAQLRDHQLPVQPGRVHPDQRLGGGPLWCEECLSRRHRRVPDRLDPVRAEQLPVAAGGGAHAAGPGRRHDGPGRAPRPAPLGDQGRHGGCDGLAHRAGADRAGDRAVARRLHHHLLPLALDLLDQRADRGAGPGARHPVHPGAARAAATGLRLARLCADGRGPGRPDVRLRDHRPRYRAGLGQRPAAGCGWRLHHALRAACEPDRPPGARPGPPAGAHLPRLGNGRLPVPDGHRRPAVPAAFAAAGGLRPQRLRIGATDLRRRPGRPYHEVRGQADPAPVRFSARASGQCLPQRALPGGDRPVPPGHASRPDPGGAAHRRLLPLAAVHQHQHAGLCRHRSAAHEPGHQLRQHGAAAVAERGRGNRRHHPARDDGSAGRRGLGGDGLRARVPGRRCLRHAVGAGLSAACRAMPGAEVSGHAARGPAQER